MSKRRATSEELLHLERIRRERRACDRCGGTSDWVETHHVRRGTEYKKHFATIRLCRKRDGKGCHDLPRDRELEEEKIVETLKQMYPESWREKLILIGRAEDVTHGG